uniref:Zinc finger protein 687-like n=1 Tax=Sinocyclocheilus grahami TaxID=75366 RepID=A0A672K7P9_SINGR
MKKFPCRLCERSFSSANSLRRHVRIIHEGVKRVFRCPHCSEGKRTFSSRLILEKKRSLPVGGGTDTDDVAGEDASGPAKRTRVSENRPPEQEEDDGTFRCTPCGFTSQDWEEFQRHIPIHCDAENAPKQCLQCGACFASAGSLSRHKFITHRLRQGQHDNRAGNASPGASPQDGSPSSPKAGEEGEGGVSCRVCGRRFDKTSDLNTHFRTHGMAFITAHRTDKPL